VAGPVSRRGAEGLLDRSSAPALVANRTEEQRIEVIAALRRLRMTGPEIECLGMALTTVSGILTRIGLGKLGQVRLGACPALRASSARRAVAHRRQQARTIQGGAGKRVRDELRQHHNPRKRDGAGVDRQTVGWEYVHVAIDDATRLAYVEVLADEQATTAVAFLRRAVRQYQAHGITIQRLITDNGSLLRSAVHAIACPTLDIRHLRTRPYRPQTNGKAERFIRILLGGWAHAIYRSSAQRTAALAGRLDRHNTRRPHNALSHKPPIALTRTPGQLL
jgi:transposase InsO family protein